MSKTPIRQQQDTERDSAYIRDTGRETLKSLAKKVLNQGVSGVSALRGETARQLAAESETPSRQERDTPFTESAARLAAEDLRIAIWISETDAGLIISGERMIQGEAAAREAWSNGALVFDAEEMLAYVQLSPKERRLFLGLKRIGGVK